MGVSWNIDQYFPDPLFIRSDLFTHRRFSHIQDPHWTAQVPYLTVAGDTRTWHEYKSKISLLGDIDHERGGYRSPIDNSAENDNYTIGAPSRCDPANHLGA